MIDREIVAKIARFTIQELRASKEDCIDRRETAAVVTRLTIAKIEIKDNLQEWHSVQDGQVNRREIEERIGKLNRVLNTLCMPFPPLADSGEKEARS